MLLWKVQVVIPRRILLDFLNKISDEEDFSLFGMA
jgi:hypothetical protein